MPCQNPDGVKIFVEYHKKHGGISRYKKFQHYFSVIQTCYDAEEKWVRLYTFCYIVQKGLWNAIMFLVALNL